MLRNLAYVTAFVSLLFTASCKQGEGEICQVDSDCESGLKCSRVLDQNVQHCTKNTDVGGDDDAGTIDAPVPDATPLDGTPAPDAGPPDATPI
jgi:hypothetical protein